MGSGNGENGVGSDITGIGGGGFILFRFLLKLLIGVQSKQATDYFLYIWQKLPLLFL